MSGRIHSVVASLSFSRLSPRGPLCATEILGHGSKASAIVQRADEPFVLENVGIALEGSDLLPQLYVPVLDDMRVPGR